MSEKQTDYQHIPGLDYDFLRYIGGNPVEMRRIQRFYLPYFQSCKHVVDLACGDGDFVALLHEMGIRVTGVDSDEKASAATQARGLPVIQQDVFEYLHAAPANSIDGIFSAHLVEHLPYPKVIELIDEAWRVLQPGGRIVLATPNVQSLFSHLEMFYLHFGHVSFYHPRLLCFFLERAGFVQPETGENPNTASPLLPAVRALIEHNADSAVARSVDRWQALNYRREIPPQGVSLLHKVSYHVKRRLTRWLVQPLTDELARQVNQLVDQRIGEIANTQLAMAQSLQSLNGAFEGFATALKPK